MRSLKKSAILLNTIITEITKIYGENKECRINIFKSTKRIFPLEINMLENHPLSSQAFIPLQKTNFIVVVAPVSEKPDINLIEAFQVFPEESINFKPKVWHFPLIATENSLSLIHI